MLWHPIRTSAIDLVLVETNHFPLSKFRMREHIAQDIVLVSKSEPPGELGQSCCFIEWTEISLLPPCLPVQGNLPYIKVEYMGKYPYRDCTSCFALRL